MRRTLILSGLAACLLAASLIYFFYFRPTQAEIKSTEIVAETTEKEKFVVAPGVVEAVSEEIEVGVEINGKIKEISVEEGDEVVRGQVIAVLENDDLTANIASAKAEIVTLERQKETAKARILQAQTDKQRIANGARVEERRAARADYEKTLPVAENARREVERRRKLVENGDIAREEYERASRDLQIAEKQILESRERFNIVNAAARADDLNKADAGIILANAQVREFDALINAANKRIGEANARLSKTIVRAPISGVILRKRAKIGEAVSPENLRSGIVSIADVSALRIRVDVDEADVAKINLNQRAYAVAETFGEEKFNGKIIKIGQILGRKNVRTEEPTERVDRKILEVLIELDANQKLPLGLRVDVFIGQKS